MYQWYGSILECLGNQGKLCLPTGSGMERRGARRNVRREGWRGLGGWRQGLGVGWGPRQLAGPGIRKGLEEATLVVGEKETAVLGPQGRGSGVTHGTQSGSPSLHVIISI